MSKKDLDYGCLGIYVKGYYNIPTIDGKKIPCREFNCYFPSIQERMTIKRIKCVADTPEDSDLEKNEIYNCYQENDKHYFYFNEYGAKCFALKSWFEVA